MKYTVYYNNAHTSEEYGYEIAKNKEELKWICKNISQGDSLYITKIVTCKGIEYISR